MSNKRILITGVGGVGIHTAHLLSTMPGTDIYLADIREQHVIAKANSVYDSAYYFNKNEANRPNVFPVSMNMLDKEAMQKQLEEIKPDVIIHLATMMAAQKIRAALPLEAAQKVYDANPVGTGLRPWAPGHCVLLFNLMSAIKDSGIQTHVVNGSGCDYLNVAFHNIGMPITCGLGDWALAEPGLVRAIAKRLDVHERDVTLYLAGHHSLIMPLAYYGSLLDIPSYIKVEVLGTDVTDKLDFEGDIFKEFHKYNSWPEVAEDRDQEQTSSHAAAIARAIVFDTNEIMNVPGPEGLPGCYPCRVNKDGVHVIIPEGTTREELIAVNEHGNVAEGFSEIRADGTMVANDFTTKIIEEEFEMEWKYREFQPHQAMEAFQEINEGFKRYVAKNPITEA